MADFEKIKISLGDLNEQSVLDELEAVIQEGNDAALALQACQDGLEIVSQHFDTDSTIETYLFVHVSALLTVDSISMALVTNQRVGDFAVWTPICRNAPLPVSLAMNQNSP